MKNVQKQLWLLLAAAAAFIVWTVTNAVFYGVFRPRADSLVMLGFWLFALTRAYRIGMGKQPFPRFQAWLEQCPGLTEAEYAAVAAKKAKAQAPVVLATETKAAPVNAAAETTVESCDSDAPVSSEPEASEPAAEPKQEEEDEVTEEEASENEESPDENLEDLM